MKILNYGSLNYDYVYQVDHMVAPGETLSARELQIHFGGKGLNQSIALARAGAPTYHAGLVGADGDGLLTALSESGVDTQYVVKTSDKSGHAIIQVNRDGENCILLFEGANGANTKEQISRVLEGFDRGDILLMQNEVNLLDEMIEAASEKGMRIVLNPSPFNEKITASRLDLVSMFLLNEVEGGQMTDETDPDRVMEAMVKRFPEAEIVLTLGKAGCYYGHQDQRESCGSFPVKAVDTTAAGDTFTGYFLASYVAGNSPKESMLRASAAAALAVMKEGASPSIPKKEAVETFLSENN